jgi:hypothetical protein
MATTGNLPPQIPDLQAKVILRDIYDEYRNALMRSKYYAYRLKTYKTYNKLLEIVLAVGTSGVVGALAIWQTGYGKDAWAVVAGLSAILVIIKPIINLQDKIEKYSTLHAVHESIFEDIKRLVIDINTTRSLSAEIERLFVFIRTRYGALGLVSDEIPKKRLVRKCYNEVNREIPPESLWMPS